MNGSDIVNLKITQIDPHNTYEPGLCQIGCNLKTPIAKCSPDDWTVRMRNCGATCPKQPICSKADPSVCPNFNNQGANNVSFDGPPNLSCSYDVSQFKNTDDIIRWTVIMGKDEQYNNKIMPEFCSTKTSEGCPRNEQGIIPTTCSILRANSQGGKLCQEWAKDNPRLAEQAARKYCQMHNTFECGCLNRGQDLEYRAFKQYVPNIPDGCWYRPCMNFNHNFIPADLQTPICVGNYCEKINDAFQNEQYKFLNYNDAQDATVCKIDPLTNGGSNAASGASFFSVILLILIIIGIIVIGYIFINMLRS